MRWIKSIFSAGHFLLARSVYRNQSKQSNFLTWSASLKFSVSSMARSDKPPNVLIYTGDSRESVFKNAAKNLLSVLNRDRYVVYELPKSQVLVQPWRDNISLLVVLCDAIEESTAEIFRNYLAKDGKLLVFCCNFTMPEMGLSCFPSSETCINVKYSSSTDMELYHGKFSYNFSNSEVLASGPNNEAVVMKTTCNKGILVISAVHLILDSEILSTDAYKVPDNTKDRLVVLENILRDAFAMEIGVSGVVPEPTPGFLIVKNNADNFDRLNNKQIPIEKGAAPKTVPLILEREIHLPLDFDKKSYFSKLDTKRFGHATVYFPIVTSTMIPVEHLSDVEGVVVIAARQTCGCGRGGNQWISPEGCAMFSLHLTVSLSSQLGQRLSVLQHMASLAVVLAVKKMPGYEMLDLHLKWPNDLYFGKDKKIGGVLANTTVQGKSVHVFIGIGVNVDNELPDCCLNSIIRNHNAMASDVLPVLTTEVVIARILTELELLVDDFTTSGPEKFLSLYYKYWLHSNQRIMLAEQAKDATVRGLDEFGFLIVKTDDGKTLTLQPDGNRFDMMKNLIISKS